MTIMFLFLQCSTDYIKENILLRSWKVKKADYLVCHFNGFLVAIIEKFFILTPIHSIMSIKKFQVMYHNTCLNKAKQE